MATGRAVQRGRAVSLSLAAFLFAACTVTPAPAGVIGPEDLPARSAARTGAGAVAEPSGRAVGRPALHDPGPIHDHEASVEGPLSFSGGSGPGFDDGFDAPGSGDAVGLLSPVDRTADDEGRDVAIGGTGWLAKAAPDVPSPERRRGLRLRAFVPEAAAEPRIRSARRFDRGLTAVSPVGAFDFHGEPASRHAIPAPGGLGLLGVVAVGYAVARRKTRRGGR